MSVRLIWLKNGALSSDVLEKGYGYEKTEEKGTIVLQPIDEHCST